MTVSPKKGDGVWPQQREMGLKKQWACNSLFMIRSLALLVSYFMRPKPSTLFITGGNFLLIFWYFLITLWEEKKRWLDFTILILVKNTNTFHNTCLLYWWKPPALPMDSLQSLYVHCYNAWRKEHHKWSLTQYERESCPVIKTPIALKFSNFDIKEIII